MSEATMAKTKQQPVKLDADLHKKVALIATQRGIGMSTYVSDLIRSKVEHDYQEYLRQAAAEYEAQKGGGKKPRTG